MRRVGTKSWHRFMVPNCKRLWAVLFLLRVWGRVVYWILEDVYNGHVTPISAEDLGELRSKLPGERHDRNAEEYIDKSYGFLYQWEGAIRAGASGLIQSSQQMEGQRRPGFAALASAAFIIKCMEHGRIIPWDAGKGTWQGT